VIGRRENRNLMDGFGHISRRDALRRAGCGFGALALAGLAAENSARAAGPARPAGPVLAPKAKRAVFLFMAGGVSHVDSFDYKPRLAREHGTQRAFDDARTLAKTGKIVPHTVMKSPWRFRQHGRSGLWISELFPHLSRQADELCVVRSLHTEGVAHGPATLFLHTGASNLDVRPGDREP
jgi:hypothetical protein